MVNKVVYITTLLDRAIAKGVSVRPSVRLSVAFVIHAWLFKISRCVSQKLETSLYRIVWISHKIR